MLVLGPVEYNGTILRTDKLSFFIQQFQCIPFFWIMAGGNDEPSCCLLPYHGQFNGRGCRQSQVNDIQAQSCHGAYNEVTDHFAAYTTIAANNDFLPYISFFDPGTKGSSKFHNIQRG